MLAIWRRTRQRTRPRSLYGNLITYMQRRLEEGPSDLRLHMSLVSHLKMAGRYEEAIQQVKRILQLHPDYRRAKGLLLRLRLEQRVAAIHRVTG